MITETEQKVNTPEIGRIYPLREGYAKMYLGDIREDDLGKVEIQIETIKERFPYISLIKYDSGFNIIRSTEMPLLKDNILSQQGTLIQTTYLNKFPKDELYEKRRLMQIELNNFWWTSGLPAMEREK
jgi:hypothetical protein